MIRFACLADVHIGRRSSGAPEETALAAFARVVDQTLSESTDALLIAGDLFDSRAAQYPARRELVRQLTRLKQRGIPVLAVAGNHDPEALRDFHRSYPALLQLLGDTAWEETDIKGVRILGRSFEKARAANLLDGLPAPHDSRPTVALLHADIDAASPYNPVRLDELRGHGVGAWVLGHVHLPRKWDDPCAAYTGSPQALDPGEPGPHGFRWLTLDQNRFTFSDVFPVSSVRYENITLTSENGSPLEDLIEDALTQNDYGNARLFLRIHLRIRDERPHIPEEPVEDETLTWQVVSTEDCPRVDLHAEARQSDARGQAARLLLALENPDDPAAAPLIEALLSDLAERRTKLRIPPAEPFDVLRGTPETDREAAVRALRAALASVLTSGRRTSS
jgi:exonuclease SbcD